MEGRERVGEGGESAAGGEKGDGGERVGEERKSVGGRDGEKQLKEKTQCELAVKLCKSEEVS